VVLFVMVRVVIVIGRDVGLVIVIGREVGS
jgi:hypothetical protein